MFQLVNLFFIKMFAIKIKRKLKIKKQLNRKDLNLSPKNRLKY